MSGIKDEEKCSIDRRKAHKYIDFRRRGICRPKRGDSNEDVSHEESSNHKCSSGFSSIDSYQTGDDQGAIIQRPCQMIRL